MGLDTIWKAVNKSENCYRNTVYKILKENNIKSKRKKKFKAITNSKHDFEIAPNLLNKNFKADNPDMVWVRIGLIKAEFIKQL